MPELLTCPNGHEFSRDDAADSNDVRCPVCDAKLPKRKGLWDVMGRPPSDHADDDDAKTPDAAPQGLWSLMGKAPAKAESESAESATSPPSPGKPRESKGLWSVMNEPATVAPADVEDDNESESECEAAAGQPKGLWSLMKSGDAQPAESPSDDDVIETDESQAATVGEEDPDEELEVAPLEELAAEEDREDIERQRSDDAAAVAESLPTPVRSRGAMKSFILGMIAIPAAALSLLPELWLRIPANLLGFLALMVGLLAVGEIRRSRGRQSGRKLALAGIATGVLALMLGPFVFTQLGQRWRQQYGRKRTYDNLQRIGDAMTKYRNKRGVFPSGKDIRKHNWQTLLLPYMGDEEAAVFERIDLKAKWDAEGNRSALATDVPAFFASGANRQKVSGYSVTHFVALGGQLTVKDTGLFHVGVLDANLRVSRNDVTDGLEQTLVAGEIVHSLPPWGEPGNFRQVGKGLTGGRDTFGNSDRTGAMFLRADGSVRFFSRDTSPEILKKLSTRNGEEKVDERHFR